MTQYIIGTILPGSPLDEFTVEELSKLINIPGLVTVDENSGGKHILLNDDKEADHE